MSNADFDVGSTKPGIITAAPSTSSQQWHEDKHALKNPSAKPVFGLTLAKSVLTSPDNQ